VFFVTQNPLDVPETVLGQLGNRIQHAMRAYTQRDQKAIRAAAQTFRSNPDLDTEQAFMQMGVGEALISTLQAKGVPGVVDRTLIRPPESRIGPISEQERSEERPSTRPPGSKRNPVKPGPPGAAATAKRQPRQPSRASCAA
jgi:DNA helicase HerA-like ATPase